MIFTDEVVYNKLIDGKDIIFSREDTYELGMPLNLNSGLFIACLIVNFYFLGKEKNIFILSWEQISYVSEFVIKKLKKNINESADLETLLGFAYVYACINPSLKATDVQINECVVFVERALRKDFDLE